MQGETRLERQLDRAVARATSPRGAAIVIASASIAVTFGSALLMTIADHKNYPSVGSGLWWAVQTVTTVGYGDVTPVTVSGRLVAALVMLVGIGFLTVITAAITSTFVSRTEGEQASSGVEVATAQQLREIDSRLDARLARIEAALTDSA
ncbi:MAG TPA: potassium channel family protein [Jatrophihabitantaceae bacterium]|jgi:voltage-gated potassium channel Kch|nr:potassium channel family protein [Jatrophihabitantaceae bacterium]